MSDCPDITVLEERSRDADVVAHLGSCDACRRLLELMDDRDDDCAQIELLLAADALGDADAARLDRHLATCSACRELSLLEGDGAAPGRYDMGAEVGRGGMGRVYEARDRQLERAVAVKVLRPGAGREAAARFRREALVTARLQHPAIVPVYEMGQLAGGEPFYAMRKIKGSTLDQALREARSAGERLALLSNVLAAAEAIAYAHSEGVIHRDLKPSNIMIGPFGETSVLDWGVAKVLGETEPEVDLVAGPYRVADRGDDLTAAGAVLGTPQYMSPEQASAEPVDARSDVYALGAILYSLLSGRPPYDGETSREVVEQVRRGEPPSIDEIAPEAAGDLRAIVHKAMAREPAQRYPTATALVDDLRRYHTGKLVSAHSYTLRQLAGRWLRRNRAVVAIATVLVGALIATATISVRRIVDERDLARAASAEALAQEARAERERLALLLEQGRQHLLNGSPAEAAVYLSRAYSEGADGLTLRHSMREALSPLEAASIEVSDQAGASFSPDGTRLAIVTKTGELEIIDAATGEVRHRHPVGERKGILAWSGDSRRVAVGVKPVTVWDAETGDKVLDLDMHWAVWGLDRTGARLYATVMQYTWMWNVDTGERVFEDTSTKQGHFWLGMTPDQRYLVGSTADGVIRLRSPDDFSVAHTMRSAQGELYINRSHPIAGLFDGNGRIVVNGPGDNRASIWRPGARAPDHVFELDSKTVQPSFSADGSLVVVGSITGVARVFDAATGKLQCELRGAGGPVQVSFAEVGDGPPRVVAIEWGQRQTTVYDAMGCVPVASFAGVATQNHRGRRFLLERDGREALVDPAAGALRLVTHAPEDVGLARRVANGGVLSRSPSVVVIDDAETGARRQRIALRDADGTWQRDVSDGGSFLIERAGDANLRVIALDPGDTRARQLPIAGPVVAATVSDDGAFAVVYHSATAGSVWDVTRATRVAELAFAPSVTPIKPAIVATHGDRFVTQHDDGSATLWKRDGSPVVHIEVADKRVIRTARFAAGGASILVYESPAEIELDPQADIRPTVVTLRSAADGHVIAELGEHPLFPPILWGELDRTGSRMLLSGNLIDTTTGQTLCAAQGEPAPGVGSFSDDGALFVHTGGFAGPVGAWVVDARTCRVLTAVGQGHASAFMAALDPAGERLALSSLDGVVSVWNARDGTLLANLPTPPMVWRVDHTPMGSNAAASMSGVIFSHSGNRLLVGGPDPFQRVWDVSIEQRTPAEIADVVERLVPLRLDGARLVPRTPPTAPAQPEKQP